MKLLSDYIQHTRQVLAQADTAQQAPLQMQLAEYLNWQNSIEQKQYLLQIINNKHLPASSPIVIKAEMMLASNLLNQMNAEEALPLAEAALRKATEGMLNALAVECKALLCVVYLYSGKLAKAEQMITEALAAISNTTDTCIALDIYAYAAFFYMDKDLKTSLQYALKAMDQAKATNHGWRIGYVYTVLGYWARESMLVQDEYNYFNEAVQLLKIEGADEYYGSALTQLSLAGKRKGLMQETLGMLYEALQIFERLGNSRQIINVHHTLGRYYRGSKQYQLAIDSYNKALDLAAKEHNTYEQAVAYSLLGQLYKDMNETGEAIRCMEQGMLLFKSSNRPTNSINMAKNLHAEYLHAGELRKAYDTLLQYTEERFKLLDENRAKEVATLQAKFDAEKKEAELRELRLQQYESELKALKAQMNPHFIFNALNSIQQVFYTGDKKQANKYMAQFSRLMRNILSASGKANISLEEDIEMLQEYLSLEGLRFGNSFSYSINTDEEVYDYPILIPPVVIQPFVENAIKHGLLHKKGEKQLDIHCYLNEGKTALVVDINDNGIGREASAAIAKEKPKHESFSTSAIQKRFDMLNQYSEQGYAFSYTDLKHSDGSAAGTLVRIHFPIQTLANNETA